MTDFFNQVLLDRASSPTSGCNRRFQLFTTVGIIHVTSLGPDRRRGPPDAANSRDIQGVGNMISIDRCACFAANPMRLSYRRD
jgi:hypothetical protein